MFMNEQDTSNTPSSSGTSCAGAALEEFLQGMDAAPVSALLCFSPSELRKLTPSSVLARLSDSSMPAGSSDLPRPMSILISLVRDAQKSLSTSEIVMVLNEFARLELMLHSALARLSVSLPLHWESTRLSSSGCVTRYRAEKPQYRELEPLLSQLG